jgi:hypothetical protein
MTIIENAGDDKLEMLRYAIKNKYAITFWYKGVKVSDPNNKKYTKQNFRRVEPFALGKSAATDKWMLRAYQFQGVTNTKNDAWKTFLVDEIKDGSVQIVYDNTGTQLKTIDSPRSDYRTDGSDKKMVVGSIKDFLKTSEPAGNKDPKYANIKYKGDKPEIENKPEEEIQLTESSGFLKWVLKLNNG